MAAAKGAGAERASRASRAESVASAVVVVGDEVTLIRSLSFALAAR